MKDQTKDISIEAGRLRLPGTLKVPDGARGVVIFAHGSGSSRLSPRNTFVAGRLSEHGLGTLLFDLLTEEEDQSAEARFDIDLLAERLVAATAWLDNRTEATRLPLGYFGASTGAAAALVAAARLGNDISAVVSRGGRPDLAGPSLRRVSAPTLLVVGGEDHTVLELNRDALAQLPCEKKLEIVPGATHLFEEPGTLERAASLAAGWFASHMGAPPRAAAGF